jgi:uncharacterized protein YjbI with pentapeptide repeats
MATTTANMGLSVPSVNDTDYPTSISDSFNAIDDHDHSSGNGVQIPSAGILDGAVGSSKLAANAVTTTKIADSNVTAAKIADSNVTTAKIADANVTEGKIAANAVTTTKIADSNVTAAKIADSNVTTAKIADANVTAAKLAGVNFNQTGGTGTYTTSSATPALVLSMTTSIYGRQVFFGLESNGGSPAFVKFSLGSGTSASISSGQITLKVDGSTVSDHYFGGATDHGLGIASLVVLPCSSFFALARGLAPGSHTFELYASVSAGCSLTIENVRIFISEIF